MNRVIEIRNHYLTKWPALKTFVEERTDVLCLGLVIDEEVEAVALIGQGHIYHVHVKAPSRRGGYGTQLVEYITRNYHDNKALRAAVSPDNPAAVSMFIKAGYRIIGFEVSWGDNRYLMEYNSAWQFKGEDPHVLVKTAFEDMAEHLYVIEALPVRIK